MWNVPQNAPFCKTLILVKAVIHYWYNGPRICGILLCCVEVLIWSLQCLTNEIQWMNIDGSRYIKRDMENSFSCLKMRNPLTNSFQLPDFIFQFYRLNCVPASNSHIEILIPNVTMWRALWLQWSHKGGLCHHFACFLYKRWEKHHGRCLHGKDSHLFAGQEKGSKETNLAAPFILESQPWEKTNTYCLKSHLRGVFVTYQTNMLNTKGPVGYCCRHSRT